jgi:hypothetical protein
MQLRGELRLRKNDRLESGRPERSSGSSGVDVGGGNAVRLFLGMPAATVQHISAAVLVGKRTTKRSSRKVCSNLVISSEQSSNTRTISRSAGKPVKARPRSRGAPHAYESHYPMQILAKSCSIDMSRVNFGPTP